MEKNRFEQILWEIERSDFYFGQLRDLWFTVERRIQTGKKKPKMDLRFSTDYCKHCGAIWTDHPDFIRPRWEYPDCHPGLYHELENVDDPELEQLGSDIEAIAERIEKTTLKISTY